MYDRDRSGQITDLLRSAYESGHSDDEKQFGDECHNLRKAIRALAVCHNVTPVVDKEELTYQAASPDEVALVKFCEFSGLVLHERTEQSIVLRTPVGSYEKYDVLDIFPFTSDSKRMGIIVRDCLTGEIFLYLKGAESVLRNMVNQNDWLDEEVEGLAREGLRTLVFARRQLTEDQYQDFKRRYKAALAVLQNRQVQVRAVIQSIEIDLELLCLSGVEDRLQDNVKDTLENLRNAGLKIWMLTGDKDETAKCIARSARLVDHTQEIFSIMVKNQRDAIARLDVFGAKIGAALLIDVTTLQIMLERCERQFVELACEAPAVICCRCSPTQKAEVVQLMKSFTGKRCCAIGDGGNDVSMIQAAHVGIGIVGKEGKQASLAADFSVTQFSHIQRLILWHGRNAYKRSARLSQFIMHRGTIISIIQAVFSSLFFFAAIPIYTGWLLVGYATIFTCLPVFSLVLDEDVTETVVALYPELYQELQKGRPLSYKTFFIWMCQSVFQGGIIMILGIVLFEERFVNIVSITFSALILSELLNVAFEIQRWHKLMVVAEMFSLISYMVSIFVLKSYFDVTYIFTSDFAWRVSVVTACSTIPVLIFKYTQHVCAPTTATKVERHRNCC